MPTRHPFPVVCLWLLLLLALPACTTSPPPRSPAADAPALLLVSIDGLRADALGRGHTPTLDRLAAAGVHAQWMRPSYPALTFPNHFTLATGLRPDHHGVVHNTMRDPALGRFAVADAVTARRPEWWQARPVWTDAERAGLVTGVWAWPGSSAPIGGITPHYFHAFDADIPLDARMDQVAGWLTAPPPRRARFVALYLEQVDQAGHRFGPDAAPTRQAIRDVDAALGRLLAMTTAAGIVLDVVVVSDHGMAKVAADHYLAVEDIAAMDEAEVVSIGQVIGVAPRPGHEAPLQARLPGRHAHYQCWRKADMPARFHYGRHPRIPPIVCQMDEGWSALPRQTLMRRETGAGHDRGAHGYDPELASMRAVFLAHGPSFASGMVLPPFDNVDVYPLLTHLLGIAPRPNGGNPATLQPALRGH